MADTNPAVQDKAARLAKELAEHDAKNPVGTPYGILKKPAESPVENPPARCSVGRCSVVPLGNAIFVTARDARGSSPVYDPSNPSPFQSYWHKIFNNLACTVASRAPLPYDKIDIKLYDEPRSRSMFPDSAPAIRLSREGGVTETDLVIGLRDYLYGERPGKIVADNSQRAEEFRDEDLGVVMWDFNRPYSSASPVMVFYFCPNELWHDMLDKQEEEMIKMADEEEGTAEGETGEE